MSIGSKVKSLRKAQKLTQVQLASKANLSRSYLADLEGDRYNPSVSTLKSIATALNVDLAELISKQEELKYLDKEKNSSEKEFLEKKLDLTDDEIKADHTFIIDGRELTEEEFRRMIAAVRAERLYREQ